MLGEKRSRKKTALLTLLMMLVAAFIPTGVFAASSSSTEYVYKYIGTDNNNAGNSIYYKENGRTSSGSTIMFKLRKDNSSTIDLAYCCDLDTYTQDNTYYKRTNIENAGYFSKDAAKKIRNVVVNGYDPNNKDASIKSLKDAANAWAKKNNRSTINSLSKENAITATQLAIWTLANGYMEPYSTSATVTLVKDYLISLPEVAAGPTEKTVESIDVTAEIIKDDDKSDATLRGSFTLYAGAVGTGDKATPVGNNLTLDIKAGSKSICSGKLSDMISSGTVTLDENALEYEYIINGVPASDLSDSMNITIEFSGTQTLPKNAYFYKTPNRGDSQNFVGIAQWSNVIDVKATAAAKLTKTGKTNVSVTEVWNDANDQDGIRPENVQVQLLADGKAHGTPMMLGSANSWTYTWENLNKYGADNARIKYTITVEGVPEGYETEDITSSITEDGKLKFTVKSKYVPKTSITVANVWDDANDQDGIRPEGVQLQLLADGEEVGDPVTLNKEAGWSYIWENLNKYGEGNAKVEYTVEEVTVPAGYTSEITGSAAEGFIVTNTHEIEKTKVPVDLAWNDADDQDGARPDSIKVQLQANGKDIGEPVDVSADDEWAYEWKDLDKYDDGEEIIYTVKEPEETSDYKYAVTGDAESGYTVTGTHEPETIDIEVKKLWEDLNDVEGLRSDNVIITLKANSKTVGSIPVNKAGDWNDAWEDLPKYEKGKEIDYSITVDGVPEGYETEGIDIEKTKDGKIKFTIKSKFVPKTSITVTNIWNDANDQDGIRPESVQLQLLADGQDLGAPVVLDEKTGWTYKWEDLIKYGEGNSRIEYTVKELNIPTGYTAETTGSAAEGYTITNSHTLEEITDTYASETKTGDDSNMILWAMMLLTSLSIMILILATGRRRIQH